MLYLTKPIQFNPKFEVVSCFVEYNNKILLLLRQDHKPQPNTYRVPAGKKETEETILQAIKRELKEESWLLIENNEITYFKEVYVKYDTYDFIYHIFQLNLNNKPNIQPTITINEKEHKEFLRTSPEEALDKNLIQDLDTCIQVFYKTP